MANDLPIDMAQPRFRRLGQLQAPLRALLEGEPSGWANLSNACAAVHSAAGWHWVGFYLVDAVEDNLVLGPFQGPVACTRLHRGKGVCAAAWESGTIQVVTDVHAFPGHVACSSSSMSELVLPVRNGPPSSFMVPAQKRPTGSVPPSLNRLPGRSASGCAMQLFSPLSGSNR